MHVARDACGPVAEGHERVDPQSVFGHARASDERLEPDPERNEIQRLQVQRHFPAEVRVIRRTGYGQIRRDRPRNRLDLIRKGRQGVEW